MLGRIKSCIENTFSKVRKNKWVRRGIKVILAAVGIKLIDILCNTAHSRGWEDGQVDGHIHGFMDGWKAACETHGIEVETDEQM